MDKGHTGYITCFPDSVPDLGLCSLLFWNNLPSLLTSPWSRYYVTGGSSCFACNNYRRVSVVQKINVSQLSHGNIFSRQSALLQACLGCYNNSCCYICHCCGSQLAKRATYITVFLTASFHLVLSAGTFAFSCLFVFCFCDFAYPNQLTARRIKPYICF